MFCLFCCWCYINISEQKEGVKLDGAARGIATGNLDANLAVVGTHKNKVCIIRNLEIKNTIDVGYTPTTVAISPDDKEICVAGEDRKFYFYNMDDQKESKCVSSNFVQQAVVCLAYSPDGKFLATADKNRHIWVWDIANKKFDEPINKGQSYQFHNSVPNSLEWTNDSKMLMSGGQDSNIYIWLEASLGKSKNIHLDS